MPQRTVLVSFASIARFMSLSGLGVRGFPWEFAVEEIEVCLGV